MTKETALVLLQQAIQRIYDEPINHGGRGWQCGGAYWRLAQVIELYLYPQLDEQEGSEHAKFLIETHGRIIRGP